ncbi:MAG: hypothetical protein ACRDRN_23515 [Sciscionella sp.]
MTGEGGSVDDRTVPEVIEGLRALVKAIDAGRIEATAVQRAYLEGAMDTLTAVAERSH